MSSARADSAPRRWIELARAGWGAALILTPGQVLGQIHDVRVDRKSVAVARVLGARHLTQAALSGVAPSPEVLAMGVWVDCVHAATALALAATDRSRTRAGLTDVGVAAVWAALGYRDLGPSANAPSRHDRRRDRLARRVLHAAPGGSALLHRADAVRRLAE